ncbi:hypothetical protein [Saccharopolyspora sp. NPDC050642]|uniref:hypothetical protein n=1 Tax=Saccharopolyspora sp. NPDC050642 TaxID=3157099 RepID=UPI0033F4E118
MPTRIVGSQFQLKLSSHEDAADAVRLLVSTSGDEVAAETALGWFDAAHEF